MRRSRADRCGVTVAGPRSGAWLGCGPAGCGGGFRWWWRSQSGHACPHASTPNIAVRHNVVVAGGGGTDCLESLTLQDRVSGTTETVPATAVFVLIGAEPRTRWLPDGIERDRGGFVVTGTDLLVGGRPPESWPLRRLPMLLESSLPGVFAVGDVRRGSVKRVAAAVGEGSIAIRLIHDYLRGNDPS